MGATMTRTKKVKPYIPEPGSLLELRLNFERAHPDVPIRTPFETKSKGWEASWTEQGKPMQVAHANAYEFFKELKGWFRS